MNEVEFDIEDELVMEDLIYLAKEYGIEPGGLFRPWQGLMYPEDLLEHEELTRGQSYLLGLEQEVLSSGPADFFYQVVGSWVFDGEAFEKLEPVQIGRLGGKKVIIDGRHRAMLCSLLGIACPVIMKGQRAGKTGTLRRE